VGYLDELITMTKSANLSRADHHDSEEESFFPWIEEATGEKGLMAVNVEQHSSSSTSLGTIPLLKSL
jgi:hypothetical protein